MHHCSVVVVVVCSDPPPAGNEAMQPGGAAVGQAATRNHAQCSSTLAQQINLSIAHGPHHEPAEDNALGLEIQATEAAFFYSTPMIPARTL
jgi:hypothetical protein